MSAALSRVTPADTCFLLEVFVSNPMFTTIVSISLLISLYTGKISGGIVCYTAAHFCTLICCALAIIDVNPEQFSKYSESFI